MFVGEVAELWRHPVKSMRGNRVASVDVTRDVGVPGDRGWALRDEQVGEIRGAKKFTSLLQFHARYLAEPRADSTPPVEITFPDGSTMTSDDERIHTTLSRTLGRQVHLWPRQPADDHEHYRRVAGSEQELREQLGLGPADPFPDHSTMPSGMSTQLASYATPPGTYFDALPLSLLTTTSLRSLAETVPESVIDSRRFRKNIIINDRGRTAFPEFDWIGRQLRVGPVVLDVVMPIPRCVMVVLPQGDLPHDRPILRSLAQQTDTNLGIYLRTVEPGHITEGDPVELH